MYYNAVYCFPLRESYAVHLDQQHKVCGITNDLFSSVAKCVTITLKKCLKWWDSEIACFAPNPFDLVPLYCRIHSIFISTQLQVHINRYSGLIRTAELNSIPNCQTFPLKKGKGLKNGHQVSCKRRRIFCFLFPDLNKNYIPTLSLISF